MGKGAGEDPAGGLIKELRALIGRFGEVSRARLDGGEPR